MTMSSAPRVRSCFLLFAMALTSLPLVGCGEDTAPVVDLDTKGGEPGTMPTPEKSKMTITKPGK